MSHSANSRPNLIKFIDLLSLQDNSRLINDVQAKLTFVQEDKTSIHAEVLINHVNVSSDSCFKMLPHFCIKIWNKSNTGETFFEKLQWNADDDDNDVLKGE